MKMPECGISVRRELQKVKETSPRQMDVVGSKAGSRELSKPFHLDMELQNLALSASLPFWIMVSAFAHKDPLFSVVSCQLSPLPLSPRRPKQWTTTSHRAVCPHCQPTIFRKRYIYEDETQPNPCHFQAAFSTTVISLASSRQSFLFWE